MNKLNLCSVGVHKWEYHRSFSGKDCNPVKCRPDYVIEKCKCGAMRTKSGYGSGYIRLD